MSKFITKLQAIWQILISDQYRVFTYRFTKYDPSDDWMRADYANWIRSEETDALDKHFKLN